MADKTRIVARAMPGENGTDITDCFDIEIGTQGQVTCLHISVRDRWVEVRADGQLDVQPVASNCIRFRPEHGLG